MVGPPLAGNSRLVGFWPILGLWHSVKFWAWAETTNTQFPSARGTFGGKIWPPKKFILETPQLYYILRFGQSDPHWWEIAKYWFCRPFWSRTAPGTERIYGWKTGKHNCPASGRFGKKTRPPTKFLLALLQLFCVRHFPRPDPHGRESAKYWGFRPFWPTTPPPWALREIPGGKPKPTVSRCSRGRMVFSPKG